MVVGLHVAPIKWPLVQGVALRPLGEAPELRKKWGIGNGWMLVTDNGLKKMLKVTGSY